MASRPAGRPPGPPLPRALQTLGFMTGGTRFLEACRRRYGDVVWFRTLFDPGFAMVFDPALVREIFQAPPDRLRAGEANAPLSMVLGSRSVLVLDGAEHLRHRRLMLPPFHGRRLAAHERAMVDAADRGIDSWPVGPDFELLAHMYVLTLDVIASAVFGIEEGDRRDELKRRIRAFLETVSRPSRVILLMLTGGRIRDEAAMRRFEERRRLMHELIAEEIEQRRRVPDLDQRDDALSLLLLARDEDGSGLTDAEVRDELVTLLVAGHETTAAGLAWTLELVHGHPEVLERARAAAAEGDSGYLDAVVKESLRIRPVVPGIGRVVRGGPFTIGDWEIPEGVDINPSIPHDPPARRQLPGPARVPPRALPRRRPARHLHVDPVRRRHAPLPRRRLRAARDARGARAGAGARGAETGGAAAGAPAAPRGDDGAGPRGAHDAGAATAAYWRDQGLSRYVGCMKTRALSLAALLVLALPAQALAAAGGGTSSFGGGGGSSGGYSGGSGGGYSGGGSGGGDAGGFLIFLAIIVGIFVWALITTALEQRRIRRRDARVSTASAEAAQDDAYLAADAVKRDAATLFKEIQLAWTDNDRARLATMVGPELMKEWSLRLEDFERKGWTNVVRVTAEPEIKYVGLVNREDDSEDRVVVRVEAELEDYVQLKGGGRMNANGESDSTKTLEEWWTLGRTQNGWMLLSIEAKDEGKHHLKSDIVATPWDDTQRLRDQSLVEGAVADKVAEGFTVAEVADLDFDGDARAAALDLSLADARFGPDVLEAAARRAVAAWAEAVDGEDRELEVMAEPRAIQELLHPGDPSGRTRLVVRGPRIRAMRIVALNAGAQPPAMTIEVDVSGTRYVQNRDTAAVVAGSDTTETSFTERWTMTLSGPDEQPWRIAGVAGAPVG